MEQTKVALLDLLIEEEVLQFGQFQLKSGRSSPYFFNLGAINRGAGIAQLGEAYAARIRGLGVGFDVVFGPAYKGIPIAVSAAMALAGQDMDVAWAFNRKEAKAHGEGGQFVGAPLTGRVLLVDDVLTAGTAVREAAGLIGAAGGQLVAVVIALDRQERQQTGSARTSVEALAQDLGVPVVSLLCLQDVIEYLDLIKPGDNHRPGILAQIKSYQDQYCELNQDRTDC